MDPQSWRLFGKSQMSPDFRTVNPGFCSKNCPDLKRNSPFFRKNIIYSTHLCYSLSAFTQWWWILVHVIFIGIPILENFDFSKIWVFSYLHRHIWESIDFIFSASDEIPTQFQEKLKKFGILFSLSF